MSLEKINKKVKKLRMVSDAKLKFLRDHMILLNEAFKDLSETQDQELDLVYAKIKEIEDRMNRQGFK